MTTSPLWLGFYDDEARVFTPWPEMYPEGAQLDARPYTVEENAAADLRAVRAANATTLKAEIAAQVDVLMDTITTLNAVATKTNANIGPADTKTVARDARAVARALIRVCRLAAGVLDSTDSGA